MLAHQILRVCRVDEFGMQTMVNDQVICEMAHEQAMTIDFKDIGLPPSLDPSFADAAGFGDLKSKFFELRLLY